MSLQPNNQDPFAEAITLAAGCGATPSQIVTVALTMLEDPTDDGTRSGAAAIHAIFDRLLAERTRIAELVDHAPVPHQTLARPPAGPPLARMRLDIGDHEVRGRLVFREHSTP